MAHVNFEVRIRIYSAPNGMEDDIPLERWGLRTDIQPECYREELVDEEFKSLKSAKEFLDNEDICLQFLSEQISLVGLKICNIYEYMGEPEVSFYFKKIFLPYKYLGKEINLVTTNCGERVLDYP